MPHSLKKLRIPLLVLLASTALLSGCAALVGREVPAPPATPDQISKEVNYLRESFFEDDCIQRLLSAAPDVSDPRSLGWKSIYSVEFPAHPLVSDDFSYTLEVAEAHRAAYLFTSGGIAGRFTVRGPIPLEHCLQGVFKR
jgi:hypothetical protein